jgi:DNA-directed RNA polymerase subunit RPC12/RpoP
MTPGANVSFGVRCTNCKASFGVAASVGLRAGSGCPRCGGVLAADQQWNNISNFTCEQCGTTVGHMTTNGDAACPGCGEKIEN